MKISIRNGWNFEPWHGAKHSAELRKLYKRAADEVSDLEGQPVNLERERRIAELEDDERDSEIHLPVELMFDGNEGERKLVARQYEVKLRVNPELSTGDLITLPGRALQVQWNGSLWTEYGQIVAAAKQWRGSGEPQENLYETLAHGMAIVLPYLA